MWLVRPVTAEDIEPILAFAETHTRALPSTLPHEREALAGRIKDSCAAFAGEHGAKHLARFLFVLEHVDSHEIKGVAGIDARAGNGQPFYNYRRDELIHASHELGISRRVEALYPSHSLTDCTLLCSLVIAEELRATQAFELLSRARLLFIAGHREWFAARTVVELQGIQHSDGSVPFWDSLGWHFFNMDFATADRHSSQLSKTFIAELMPPNPIYVTLLSEAAQQALGEAHPATVGNLELLQREGFGAGHYVDIFDGGPVLEARTDSLHSIAASRRKILRGSADANGPLWLLAAGEGQGFCCTLTPVGETLDAALKVPIDTWRRLGGDTGDSVRGVPL